MLRHVSDQLRIELSRYIKIVCSYHNRYDDNVRIDLIVQNINTGEKDTISRIALRK